ncbi:Uncharacterised protein [Orientia tsutsugamushi]|uniref:Uncharacterized protein n=1 Tax=Orientia tsutsugamushi TaxID=784 RepID=A0A2U3RSC2_ORITS|nr:hypothetical protein [Orientia tsutsugamushi]KJV52622.1 hypothetical protein OTSKARP_1322 [Orientia tsutsugamushi str. Karp]SPR16102.1 Uncharacterised protein [Orientia tsutsugamushi]
MIDIVEISDTKIDQLAAVVLEYKVFVDAKLLVSLPQKSMILMHCLLYLFLYN